MLSAHTLSQAQLRALAIICGASQMFANGEVGEPLCLDEKAVAELEYSGTIDVLRTRTGLVKQIRVAAGAERFIQHLSDKAATKGQLYIDGMRNVGRASWVTGGFSGVAPVETMH